jgi:hypothetical protein
LSRAKIRRNAATGEYSPNDALYLTSRRDAAIEIEALMNKKFETPQKPVVHHRRPQEVSA